MERKQTVNEMISLRAYGVLRLGRLSAPCDVWFEPDGSRARLMTTIENDSDVTDMWSFLRSLGYLEQTLGGMGMDGILGEYLPSSLHAMLFVTLKPEFQLFSADVEGTGNSLSFHLSTEPSKATLLEIVCPMKRLPVARLLGIDFPEDSTGVLSTTVVMQKGRCELRIAGMDMNGCAEKPVSIGFGELMACAPAISTYLPFLEKPLISLSLLLHSMDIEYAAPLLSPEDEEGKPDALLFREMSLVLGIDGDFKPFPTLPIHIECKESRLALTLGSNGLFRASLRCSMRIQSKENSPGISLDALLSVPDKSSSLVNSLCIVSNSESAKATSDHCFWGDLANLFEEAGGSLPVPDFRPTDPVSIERLDLFFRADSFTIEGYFLKARIDGIGLFRDIEIEIERKDLDSAGTVAVTAVFEGMKVCANHSDDCWTFQASNAKSNTGEKESISPWALLAACGAQRLQKRMSEEKSLPFEEIITNATVESLNMVTPNTMDSILSLSLILSVTECKATVQFPSAFDIQIMTDITIDRLNLMIANDTSDPCMVIDGKARCTVSSDLPGLSFVKTEISAGFSITSDEIRLILYTDQSIPANQPTGSHPRLLPCIKTIDTISSVWVADKNWLEAEIAILLPEIFPFKESSRVLVRAETGKDPSFQALDWFLSLGKINERVDPEWRYELDLNAFGACLLRNLPRFSYTPDSFFSCECEAKLSRIPGISLADIMRVLPNEFLRPLFEMIPESIASFPENGNLSDENLSYDARSLLLVDGVREEQLPRTLLPYLDIRIPSEFYCSFKYSGSGLAQFDFDFSRQRNNGKETPLTLICPSPLAVGIQIKRVALYQCLAHAFFAFDGRLDLFPLPFVNAFALLPDLSDFGVDSGKYELSLTMDNFLAFLPSAIPLPVSMDKLVIRYRGYEGAYADSEMRLNGFGEKLISAGISALFSFEPQQLTAEFRIEKLAMGIAAIVADAGVAASPFTLSLGSAALFAKDLGTAKVRIGPLSTRAKCGIKKLSDIRGSTTGAKSDSAPVVCFEGISAGYTKTMIGLICGEGPGVGCIFTAELDLPSSGNDTLFSLAMEGGRYVSVNADTFTPVEELFGSMALSFAGTRILSGTARIEENSCSFEAVTGNLPLPFFGRVVGALTGKSEISLSSQGSIYMPDTGLQTIASLLIDNDSCIVHTFFLGCALDLALEKKGNESLQFAGKISLSDMFPKESQSVSLGSLEIQIPFNHGTIKNLGLKVSIPDFFPNLSGTFYCVFSSKKVNIELHINFVFLNIRIETSLRIDSTPKTAKDVFAEIQAHIKNNANRWISEAIGANPLNLVLLSLKLLEKNPSSLISVSIAKISMNDGVLDLAKDLLQQISITVGLSLLNTEVASCTTNYDAIKGMSIRFANSKTVCDILCISELNGGFNPHSYSLSGSAHLTAISDTFCFYINPSGVWLEKSIFGSTLRLYVRKNGSAESISVTGSLRARFGAEITIKNYLMNDVKTSFTVSSTINIVIDSDGIRVSFPDGFSFTVWGIRCSISSFSLDNKVSKLEDIPNAVVDVVQASVEQNLPHICTPHANWNLPHANAHGDRKKFRIHIDTGHYDHQAHVNTPHYDGINILP